MIELSSKSSLHITFAEKPVSSNLLPNSICGFDSQDRIYGGKEAELNEFPWMALVEYERGKTNIFWIC